MVQTNQEDYVARAWAQVTAILAMNRRLKFGRFAMETANTMQASFFAKLSPVTLLAVARPVARKVMGSPVTIHRLVEDSLVSGAPLNAAMRRLLRPRGVMAQRLRATDAGFSQDRLVDDINAGRVTAAPPKTMPDGLPSDDAVAAGAGSGGPVPGWLGWLQRYLWWILLLLLLLALLLLANGLWLPAIGCVAIAIAVYAASRRAPGRAAVGPGIADPSTLPGTLAAVPPQPGFSLVETDPPPRPGAGGISLGSGHVAVMPGGIVSVIATSSHPGGAGGEQHRGAEFPPRRDRDFGPARHQADRAGAAGARPRRHRRQASRPRLIPNALGRCCWRAKWCSASRRAGCAIPSTWCRRWPIRISTIRCTRSCATCRRSCFFPTSS